MYASYQQIISFYKSPLLFGSTAAACLLLAGPGFSNPGGTKRKGRVRVFVSVCFSLRLDLPGCGWEFSRVFFSFFFYSMGNRLFVSLMGANDFERRVDGIRKCNYVSGVGSDGVHYIIIRGFGICIFYEWDEDELV